MSKQVCRFCGEMVKHPCTREGTPDECRYTNWPAHRHEPKPSDKRDAEWAVIARAAELVDYVKQHRKGDMQHITEVRLIEAIDDFREFNG